MSLLGHAMVLQSSVLVASPTHAVPPFLGLGSSQVRVKLQVPPPQGLEHALGLDQGDQAPSTNQRGLRSLVVTSLLRHILSVISTSDVDAAALEGHVHHAQVVQAGSLGGHDP